MLSVYIAGLKKGTGKTLLSAGLAGTMQSLSYATSYFKPIQTGSNLLNDDADFLNRIDKNIKTFTSYKFQSISCPLVGAYKEGIKQIDIMKIMHEYKNNIMMTDCHIVEGCNSIYSPIDDKITEISLIEQFVMPLILVVNPLLSDIGEVISGINYIRANNINLMGVVINDYDISSEDIEIKYFPHLIKEFTGVKILGSLPHYPNFENLEPQILISDILNRLDIEDIFSLRIAKLI